MINSNIEALNSKQISNSNTRNSKNYDLEIRTLNFAKLVREFIKRIPRTMSNLEDGPQLVRSSGSVGGNYIEANELFSRKDFIFRVKISRKEAKESIFWLELIETGGDSKLEIQRQMLIKESTELMKIFGAIVSKVS
jgi:four helix bundle protein